jgi:Flp pilus assembly protein TadD
MKYATLKLTLLAVVLVLCRYSAAAPVPQQEHPDLSNMTVSDLEKTGDQARSQKNYYLAIECFKIGISKDSKNAVLYNKLGLSQLRMNDMVSARANFEKASKLNSKFADAVRTTARLQSSSREPSRWKKLVPHFT